jgi:DNA polymerase III alpha subunit
MGHKADIDIDFKNRDDILSKIDHRVAKMAEDRKHNTGIYITEIPHNPVDNIATIDYKTANERGYFKLDFLNVHIYQDVTSEEHLNQLIDQEPMWELLQHDEITNDLFHVSGHTHIMKVLKPKSLKQLAAALAIIRPAKRYLLNESWDKINKEVWTKPTDGAYYFKKSHAHSYAMAVMVHLNLLTNGI